MYGGGVNESGLMKSDRAKELQQAHAIRGSPGAFRVYVQILAQQIDLKKEKSEGGGRGIEASQRSADGHSQ